ncbi:hypothetical protein [Actinomadura macrotermitis]|uniref:Uncharacterized protein n=1 Tax=Actinomadura macrotermitis TaxID=2585200 RepID=A0A7K0C7L1_9ACTN|nr:hypothetical protein [Actinomadura macrotermitis]MQY09423.1 hypothetical protein [Actinomadura macrotermitis]
MTDQATLATTRKALHAVAELVMAGPQHRDNGSIRLTVTPGGFATVAAPELRVEDGELVGDGRVPLNGTTCRELAAAFQVDPGAPKDLYKEGSGAGLDDRLEVDSGAARHLAECLAIGQAALTGFAPASEPVLWPEHFDLGITVDEVNYGVSLGDGYLNEPYAYAGPWKARSGEFWNAPFGAVRPIRELADATAVQGFFQEARERAGSDPVQKP